MKPRVQGSRNVWACTYSLGLPDLSTWPDTNIMLDLNIYVQETLVRATSLATTLLKKLPGPAGKHRPWGLIP